MIDVNVLNYFLVILGGFGVVWGYRHFSKSRNKRIGEFEYAAFSALWGIPVFLVFFQLMKGQTQVLDSMFAMPMLASPYLFIIGAALGYVGSQTVDLLKFLKGQLKK